MNGGSGPIPYGILSLVQCTQKFTSALQNCERDKNACVIIYREKKERDEFFDIKTINVCDCILGDHLEFAQVEKWILQEPGLSIGTIRY